MSSVDHDTDSDLIYKLRIARQSLLASDCAHLRHEWIMAAATEHGWAENQSDEQKWSIWRHPDPSVQPWMLTIPLDSADPDYPLNIYKATEDLGRSCNMTKSEIYLRVALAAPAASEALARALQTHLGVSYKCEHLQWGDTFSVQVVTPFAEPSGDLIRIDVRRSSVTSPSTSGEWLVASAAASGKSEDVSNSVIAGYERSAHRQRAKFDPMTLEFGASCPDGGDIIGAVHSITQVVIATSRLADT